MKFPIKHIDDNIIINHNNEIWAYYKIEGFSYDFLDFNQKKTPFLRQFSFLSNIGLDLHMLSVPHPTDIEGILNSTIDEVKLREFALKNYAISFMEQTMSELKRLTDQDETSEYYDYIGIQLDPSKNKYISSNPILELFTLSKNFIDSFDLATYYSMELNSSTDILVDVLRSFKSQARTIELTLSNTFSSANSKVVKAKTYELLNIIEKTYSIKNNNSDIPLRKDFKSGKKFSIIDDNGKEIEVIRTSEDDFVELQNTKVEQYYNPKYLRLNKTNENSRIEQLYTQYFVISDMENISFHPGFEWLHYLKLQLGFPVTVSIRVDNVPNDIIKKRLSNVKLEIKDQKDEARKGNSETDTAVDQAGSGVVQLEKYFSETGYPSHACNFVIKITAETEEQLKERGISLRNHLSKRGIKVVAPYGEQVKLMYEALPGSKKMFEDYKMEVESGLLAGMMFGTSTNIGDNRGFYIGHTSVFNKPVFVQPDLAAKAYDNLDTVVDSISVLVAGMTGRGKSFFMNLFIYLSALTGSRGLIIDPKGDRTGWVNGLPYIPKEEIEVWTLGADKRDAGSLDPFRTSANVAEGSELVLDILSFLTGVKVEDLGYGLLTNAVNEVAETDDPCIGSIIDRLEEWYEKKPDKMTDSIYLALEGVVTTLGALQTQTLSSLLFGKVGQNYKTLNYDKTIQVLMIQNLNLANENKTNLMPSEKISEAIMISITAWTKRYMINNERSIHKFILQDEASAVERNETGSILMDHIVRQGRYWNTTLLKGSQNASDHGRDVTNMGMKFSFSLRKEEEAIEMLNYLNLPVTNANVDKLMSLNRGECLFQDIYGRTAQVKIDPVFQNILDAFDSSTSTEEERERERQRI